MTHRPGPSEVGVPRRSERTVDRIDRRADLLKEIGLRCARHRRGRRLTQAEVAARAGLERSYISAVEKGRRNPTLIALADLADAVGCSLYDLIPPPGQALHMPSTHDWYLPTPVVFWPPGKRWFAMTAVVRLRCDFCDAESDVTATNPRELRDRLASAELPAYERWAHSGHKDCCPACAPTPAAARHRTRAVQWLMVSEGDVLGHAVRRKAALDALASDYGLRSWSNACSKRPAWPTLLVNPVEEGSRDKFIVECPDGVEVYLVSREVAAEYTDEFCEGGEDVHLALWPPRNPIKCWIDVGDFGRDKYGLYLEGWERPLETAEDADELILFAEAHEYDPELRYLWADDKVDSWPDDDSASNR